MHAHSDAPIDALIVGAGPAGCAAASVLAGCGHRVLVVHRPGGANDRLAESIPPSTFKLFAVLGWLEEIEAAGFSPWRGNTVWWGADEPRVESFGPGVTGYQVERRAFDERLQALAAAAGADVVTGTVRELALPDDRGSLADGVVEIAGVSQRVSASFVLDCSGRSGVLARRGLRVHEPSLQTIALAALWTRDSAWAVPDDTHTLVASYSDGWAWSVPTSPRARQFTVMVDPARTVRRRDAPPREVYLAELSKVRPFAPVLNGGTLVEGPWGADASLYHATRYAGPGFLLVGDAASSIDPLSSFGVKKALASGWLAGIAVHTALVNPHMAGEALAFFDRRERTTYAGARRQAQAFAAAAAARTEHPFWLSRAQAPVEADEDEPDAGELARDPAVQGAFARLRAHATLRVAAGPESRIAPRAAVRGREIVRADHVFVPAWPAGVRYLRGVDLVALARLAPAYRDAGALFDAFSLEHPGASLPDFLGALSVLIARGVLREVPE